MDFQESETRSVVLQLDTLYSNRTMYAVRMSSNSNVTVPFTLSYTVDPLDPTAGVIYALVLLCALYVLIVFEVSWLKIYKNNIRFKAPSFKIRLTL